MTDASPGIRRRRAGQGLQLHRSRRQARSPTGTSRLVQLARHPARLDRCLDLHPTRGHLQATGRDARGRKQYRYHPRWREVRDDAKYGRMIAFGPALPAIRRRVDADLRRARAAARARARGGRRSCSKDAHAGRQRGIRPREPLALGSPRCATVMPRSAAAGSVFDSRARAARQHDVELSDGAWPGSSRAARTFPGRSSSSTWTRTASARAIGSDDVNAYLREITGEDFTAKDFRTWAGTVLAAMGARRSFEGVGLGGGGEAQRGAGHRAGGRVARQHAGRVAPRQYVHPAVIDAYLEGDVVRARAQTADRTLREDLRASRRRRPPCWPCSAIGLREEERAPGPVRPRPAAAARAGSPRCPASGRPPCADAAAPAGLVAQPRGATRPRPKCA